MKKLLYFALVSIAYCHTNIIANNQNDGNYIINLTGKLLVLNYYAKNPFTGKKTWVDIQSTPTLLLAGKNPDTFLDKISATLLPKPFDMHPMTCYQVSFDAANTNSNRFSSADNFFKKYKDKSIQGVTIPTPPVDLLPHDYKVELKNNQIVVTRLNTRMLIPIPGTKQSDLQQWPSAESMRVLTMSAQEKLDYYQQKNTHLTADVKQLSKEIKKYSDKAAVTKMNNRKKMKTNKKEEISKNQKKIAQLQAQIAAAGTVDTTVDQGSTQNDILQNQDSISQNSTIDSASTDFYQNIDPNAPDATVLPTA